MTTLPPIAPNSSASRNTVAAAVAGAAANRRVSFNVPQLSVRDDSARSSDSVEGSAGLNYMNHSQGSTDSGISAASVIPEGKDCAHSGTHTGRFSLTSRSRLGSVGNTFLMGGDQASTHVARRIWGGQVDNISHGEMLQRVRGQFKKQYEREHLPLVLPAQIPSSERAAVPQLPKFSRGIRQYKRVHGTLGFDGTETELSADDREGGWGEPVVTDDAGRAASAPAGLTAVADSTACADGAEGTPETAAADAEARVEEALQPTEATPLNARQLESMAAAAALGAPFPDLTRHDATPRGGRRSAPVDGAASPLGWAPPAARRRTSSARRASLLHADAPLGALATYEERWQRLREIEQLERLHIMSTEQWDRQVVVEMMVAHYVSFVLKPEMEELQARERTIRGFIAYEEEHDRYELFNTHPLAITLRTELRALEAKKLKLTRIEQTQRATEATNGGDSTPLPLGRQHIANAETPVANAALLSHDTAAAPSSTETPAPSSSLASRRSSHDATSLTNSSLASASPSQRGASADNSGTAAGDHVVLPLIPTTKASFESEACEGNASSTADDARVILQRYARRKHARELKEAERQLNGGADAPAVEEDDDTPCPREHRRASELVIPRESVAARAPRRNTVGIADYIALLDEDGAQRALLAQSERAERNQIYRLLQDELAVVMDWQRKRMHLERLLYWRNLREEQLRKEVEALTDLSDPRAIDPKTAMLLSTIEEAEEESREEIEKAESNALADIQYWGSVLTTGSTGDDMANRHGAFLSEAFCEYCDDFLSAVETLETASRASLECEEAAAWSEDMLLRAHGVRALYDVSVNPEQYAAVCTLQRYTKASLNGRLGRHYTNVQLGRDIQAVRNERKIQHGLHSLRSFQQTLHEEEAAILAEIAEEHAAQRDTLLEAEQRSRITLTLEEEWSFAVVRHNGETSAEEAYAAWKRRLVKDEHTQRVKIDVLEEVQRERVGVWEAEARDRVMAMDALMVEQAAQEACLVEEQADAWHCISAAAYDSRELIRIDAEERENAMTVAEDTAPEKQDCEPADTKASPIYFAAEEAQSDQDELTAPGN